MMYKRTKLYRAVNPTFKDFCGFVKLFIEVFTIVCAIGFIGFVLMDSFYY